MKKGYLSIHYLFIKVSAKGKADMKLTLSFIKSDFQYFLQIVLFLTLLYVQACYCWIWKNLWPYSFKYHRQTWIFATASLFCYVCFKKATGLARHNSSTRMHVKLLWPPLRTYLVSTLSIQSYLCGKKLGSFPFFRLNIHKFNNEL